MATVWALPGCSKSEPSGHKPGGVVSLSPAATNLLRAMGLVDRIVGVSPFDADRQLRQTLPKVGDYERIDWERVTALKPAYLIVQGRKDRMPAGQRERCQLLGIVPIILQIDRLDDIRQAVVQLGEAMHEQAAAKATVDAFDRRRAALRTATPADPVPTLLAFADDPARVAGGTTGVAGVDTFLDDALALAGGKNVVTVSGYPTIDREKLVSLSPAAVFVLLPGKDEAAAKQAVDAFRAVLPRARVRAVTRDDTLMPGVCALDLADTLAQGLKDAR